MQNVAEEIGGALEEAFADPVRRQQMGACGRRFVEAEASDDIMAARTEAVYKKVMSDE